MDVSSEIFVFTFLTNHYHFLQKLVFKYKNALVSVKLTKYEIYKFDQELNFLMINDFSEFWFGKQKKFLGASSGVMEPAES